MPDLNLFIVLYPVIAVISIIGIIKNKEKVAYFSSALILILVSMFRFDFQYDYFWYWIVGDKSLEKNIVVARLYNNLEYGVARLYDVVRELGHPQYFFGITALTIMGLITYTFYRDSRNPIISITLFLLTPTGFLSNNEFIMQALAGSIIFFSTQYIYQKKVLKFIFIVFVVSFLFHSSAIICLSFIFIPKKEKKIGYLIFITMLIGLILKYLFPLIIYRYFFEYYYFLYGIKYLKNSNLYNLKILGLFLIIIIFTERMKLKNIFNKNFKLSGYEIYQKNIFIYGYLGSLLIYYVFEGDLSRRIGFYFYYFAFLVAGNYIGKINIKIFKVFCSLLILLCLGQEILKIYKEDSIILNKRPYLDENRKFISRPNSVGLKLFFGKKYGDMSPYLPGTVKFKR